MEIALSLVANRKFALLSAAIYPSAGFPGFLATGADDFVGNADEKLIILGLNPLLMSSTASWLRLGLRRRPLSATQGSATSPST